MGGKVVRLRQGKAQDVTVYSDCPDAVAQKWEAEGAEWIHLVDLDGAFKGTPSNMAAVSAIVRSVSIPCELGGGLRSEATVRAALDAGVKRVILGSKACDTLDFVSQMVEIFGSDAIAVGIDAKDGKVAVKGWTETSTRDALDMARDAGKAGAGTLIYTDIATDGMLKGPNLPAMREMVSAVDMRVIASGGVGSCEDVRHLSEIPGLYGVIVGKALYDQKVNLPELLTI